MLALNRRVNQRIILAAPRSPVGRRVEIRVPPAAGPTRLRITVADGPFSTALIFAPAAGVRVDLEAPSSRYRVGGWVVATFDPGTAPRGLTVWLPPLAQAFTLSIDLEASARCETRLAFDAGRDVLIRRAELPPLPPPPPAVAAAA